MENLCDDGLEKFNRYGVLDVRVGISFFRIKQTDDAEEGDQENGFYHAKERPENFVKRGWDGRTDRISQHLSQDKEDDD